jgi:hypothetical protein
VFRGCTPTARAFARLRIAGAVADPGARLATGLPGWALAGRDSHPLDDFSEFRESPHGSFLSDQGRLVALLLAVCGEDAKAELGPGA